MGGSTQSRPEAAAQQKRRESRDEHREQQLQRQRQPQSSLAEEELLQLHDIQTFCHLKFLGDPGGIRAMNLPYARMRVWVKNEWVGGNMGFPWLNEMVKGLLNKPLRDMIAEGRWSPRLFADDDVSRMLVSGDAVRRAKFPKEERVQFFLQYVQRCHGRDAHAKDDKVCGLYQPADKSDRDSHSRVLTEGNPKRPLLSQLLWILLHAWPATLDAYVGANSVLRGAAPQARWDPHGDLLRTEAQWGRMLREDAERCRNVAPRRLLPLKRPSPGAQDAAVNDCVDCGLAEVQRTIAKHFNLGGEVEWIKCPWAPTQRTEQQ